MSTGKDQGEANVLQGDFGEAWLEVLAAANGILHGRPTTLDLEKADIELILRGKIGQTYNPTVKAQVKTISSELTNDGDSVSYPLDVITHNVLCRRDHAVRRVLVVVSVPAEATKRVRHTDEGMLLLGKGLWTSLEGNKPSVNKTTQVIKLPIMNTLDTDGLFRMLETYGVNRSTPVPERDFWQMEKQQ